jgi:hypothetical protein
VAHEGFTMSEDPNVWWSKEIGKDLNDGMLQDWRDLMKKSPRERWHVFLIVIGAFLFGGGFDYMFYRLLIRFAYWPRIR